MAIDISKYVEITSGIGGSSVARQRDLMGRIFTDNARVPIDTVLTVNNADEADAYFGAASATARRARFYFSFVAKNISAPEQLSFSRWARVATPPQIFGVRTAMTLAGWKTITNGSLTVRMGEDTAVLTGLNFGPVVALSGVATIVQTALRAAGGAQFVNASVAFDPVLQTFNLLGSVATEAVVFPVTTGVTDIADELGWSFVGAVYSPGTPAVSLTDTLDAAAAASNNFGSFCFTATLDDVQMLEVAQWNAARNVEFIYCAPTLPSAAVSRAAMLFNLAGTALTLTDGVEFDEMVPMVVLAATDYSRRNAAQNYMYQQLALTPKVTSRVNSDAYDGIRVNYYGVTQTAGQQIAFYQRGVMMGGAVAPVDINTYANEMWLKDAAAAALMSLLLTVPRVPANAEGRGMVMAILQDAVDRALRNGVISVGKELTQVQKLFITQASGDAEAWYQVQSSGYWLDCAVEPLTTTDGRVEYQAVYTLIYGKDDAIRRVEGTHVLI